MIFEEYVDIIKSSELHDKCPVKKSLELLDGKWRIHVLFELSKKDTVRFGEMKRAIPKITNTMLTSTLRDLEDAVVVNRKQFNEMPPRVEYSLTESGKALMPVFFEIAKWGSKYLL